MSPPRNFADEAHQANAYVDPTDPEQRKLAGVTTVLKKAMPPYLVPWASKLTAEYAIDNLAAWQNLDREAAVTLLKGAPDRSRDKAGAKGTVTHRFLEMHAKGELDPDEIFDGDAIPYIKAGLAFLNDWKPRFIWQEATVFHPELGYAGTLDFIAELPGMGVVIGDYKTSKGIYPETAVQLAAYRYASHAVCEGPWDWERLAIPAVDGGVVVHLKGDGTYDLKPAQCDERAFNAFKACLAVGEWKASTRGVIGRAAKIPAEVGAPTPASAEPTPASVSPTAAEGAEGETVTAVAPAGADTTEDLLTSVVSVPFAEVKSWLLRRMEPIKADKEAGHTLAVNWPLGLPVPINLATFEQIDAAVAIIAGVEREHGLPFGHTDPRTVNDKAGVDREHLDALAASVSRLPADLRPDVALVRSTQARYAADLTLVAEAIDVHAGRAAQVVHGINEILTALDPTGTVDAAILRDYIATLVSVGHTDRAGMLTADDVARFDALVEAATTGYLILGDGKSPHHFSVDTPSAELFASVFGGKRAALSAAKRAAKANGIASPARFDDAVSSPLLVALALAGMSDADSAPATAAA